VQAFGLRVQRVLQSPGAGDSFTEAATLLGLPPNNLHWLVRTLNLRAALKK